MGLDDWLTAPLDANGCEECEDDCTCAVEDDFDDPDDDTDGWQVAQARYEADLQRRLGGGR
jgi:hypothetical protein